MPRREYTGNWPCRQPGCREQGFYIYDTQRDYREAARRYAEKPWVCTRHTQPEQVLSVENSSRQVEITASRLRTPGYERDLALYEARKFPYLYGDSTPPAEFLPGLFWTGGGVLTSGLTDGPGFKAFANDFPEGTRLRVTVEVLPPAAAPPVAA